MIIDYSKQFCFIHIPRGAGLSITQTLRQACPEADIFYHSPLRHYFAIQAINSIGIGKELWERFYKFAVIRSPFDIIESDYRLTLHESQVASPSHLLHGWNQRIVRLKKEPGFDSFVRREILGPYSGIKPGGYWRTWCLGHNGEDLGVDAILYTQLHDKWPAICKRIGLSESPVLLRINAADMPKQRWNPNIAGRVASLCSLDLNRFGFEVPK